MILSDTAIFEALDDGRLTITPSPAPRMATIEQPSSPFDTTAVNLRLGATIRTPIHGLEAAIDPQSGNTIRTLQTLYRSEPLPESGYVLRPNSFILGVTLESVSLALPSDLPAEVRPKGCLAARVEGKSSLARFGLLVHFTAPTIHAGFTGTITLEMMNLGPRPIILTGGMAICQLIIEQVIGEPLAGASQFQGQTDPAGPIAH